MVCKDSYWNCLEDAQFCDVKKVFTNGGFELVRDVCSKSCGDCSPTPLTCQQANNICQNGATCSNTNVPDSSSFGFRCICKLGYSGELCETKISDNCSPNPCNNGGTCQQFGSTGYVCLCPNNCSGYNCSECSNNSVSTSSTPAMTTQTDTRPQEEDFDKAACEYYKSQDLCEQNAFIGSKPIKEACPITCRNQLKTTAKPVSPSTDINTEICKYYKSIGLCDQNAFIGSLTIKEACAITCSNIESTTLTTTTLSPCQDEFPESCVLWSNFCSLLNELPNNPCKKTCSFC